jgi:hypothetical protein
VKVSKIIAEQNMNVMFRRGWLPMLQCRARGEPLGGVDLEQRLHQGDSVFTYVLPLAIPEAVLSVCNSPEAFHIVPDVKREATG